MLVNMSETRPAIESVMPGAVPLYGTCVRSILASSFRFSVARCDGLALPDDA